MVLPHPTTFWGHVKPREIRWVSEPISKTPQTKMLPQRGPAKAPVFYMKLQLSHEKKNLTTFHYTGWLIGILIVIL